MNTASSMLHVGLVLEGKGERDAMPLLLRKYFHSMGRFQDCLGKPVVANGRGQLTKPGGIEGFVATAASRPGCAAVLVVADVDDDKSCKLGPELQMRGQSVTDKLVVVALAERCFEDWIYASVETLELGEFEYDSTKRGGHMIAWIVKMSGTKYVKPVWQPRLTHRIDIEIAKERNASLRRLLLKSMQLAELTDL